MEILHFIYNGETVDFSKDENIMINATQMAKLFDKRTDNFLRLDETKRFISVLEKHNQEEFEKNNLPHIVGSLEKKVIDFRGRNGVYFDRRLALKFAAWLDVKFELWVYDTIDKILLGKYQEHKEATLEKIQAKKEFKALQEEILKSDPRFEKLAELEAKMSKATRKQSKVISEAVKQLELNFSSK